jgi:membrane protease YdiL (CAAX protease family)
MSDHPGLLKKPNSFDRWVLVGISYTFLVVIIGGYVNYTFQYSSDPVDSPTFFQLWIWSLLYIPFLVFPFMAKWEVKNFGFSINPVLLFISIFIILLCGLTTLSSGNTAWLGGLVEAYARTGEEAFFRGFVFLLLLKICKNKRRPWIWAAVFSSLIFTLVHTQTFQPGYFPESMIGYRPYLILERMVNVFIAGFVLALLRHWTNSVLPGSIIHSLTQGGLISLPFVLLIYTFVVFWGITRKEKVIFGFSTKPRAIE